MPRRLIHTTGLMQIFQKAAWRRRLISVVILVTLFGHGAIQWLAPTGSTVPCRTLYAVGIRARICDGYPIDIFIFLFWKKYYIMISLSCWGYTHTHTHIYIYIDIEIIGISRCSRQSRFSGLATTAMSYQNILQCSYYSWYMCDMYVWYVCVGEMWFQN